MASPVTSARIRLPLLIAVAAALGVAIYATRPSTISAPAPTIPAPVTVPPPPEPVMPAAPPSPAPVAPPRRGNIPGLSVNATFATRSGGGSISITRPDGSHAMIATGTDAMPDIRLIAVAADRATFVTGGTVFWLPILSESAARADPAPAMTITAAPPPPPASTTPTDAQRRESQVYQAALTPSVDGPYRGYSVRAQTPLFAKAGLKPGDVITGINGRAFADPAEIATLSREAALSETLVFTIRRDGRSQELRVTQK